MNHNYKVRLHVIKFVNFITFLTACALTVLDFPYLYSLTLHYCLYYLYVFATFYYLLYFIIYLFKKSSLF